MEESVCVLQALMWTSSNIILQKNNVSSTVANIIVVQMSLTPVHIRLDKSIVYYIQKYM